MSALPQPYLERVFPGLRPFEELDAVLFFGRDEQTDELLRRLDDTRFVAVVGLSGGGKSSLVRAGLLPALRRGHLTGAGAQWRIAVMRPGTDPIGTLAQKLDETLGPREDREATLRSRPLGLLNTSRYGRTPDENLLIVVDQFEEIFRFQREDRKSATEATEFVRLLLAAVREYEPDYRTYVVITMRSDYFGECARFQRLPEALNESQYLVPRMTTDQLREAIEGPVALGGAEIAPELVERLLHDIGDDLDQLPLLQHALMCTWDKWQNLGRSGPVGIKEYESIGGMAGALSLHADEVFDKLADDQTRAVAQRLFQCLCERSGGNRDVRRPTKLSDICAITEADEPRVTSIIEAFRTHGNTFLTPPEGENLNGQSMIDISHESLIRHWTKLRKWVEDEAKSAAMYQRLADAALRYGCGEAPLWRDPELRMALNWQKEARPNQAWAERYSPNFELARQFLQKSRRAHRNRMIGYAAIIVLLVSAVLTVFYLKRSREAYAIVQAERLSLLANSSLSDEKDPLVVRTLLFVESMRLRPSLESDKGLRESLAMLDLPKPVLTLPPTLPPDAPTILVVAFSPDGKYLATAGEDGVAQVFDRATGKKTPELRSPSAVVALAYSPDGRYVATASQDRTARIFEVVSGTSVEVYPLKNLALAIGFSPDGRQLVTGGTDGAVQIFDLRKPARALKPIKTPSTVLAAAYSRNGRYLLTAGLDNTLRRFEVSTGKEIWTKRLPYSVIAAVFSPDGRYTATASNNNTVIILDIQDSSLPEVARFSDYGRAVDAKDATATQPDRINSLAFSLDGRYLATASNKAARVIDRMTSREVVLFTAEQAVRSVAFSPDGRYVAAAGDDKFARIFEVPKQPDVWSPKRETLLALALSPDGQRVAILEWDDGRPHIHDVTNDTEPVKLGYEGSAGHPVFVRNVAFSTDGRYIITAGGEDATARIFDAYRGGETRKIPHSRPVLSAVFSADGQYAATADEDHVVRVFELNTGTQVSKLRHEGSVSALALGKQGTVGDNVAPLVIAGRDNAGQYNVTVFEFGRNHNPREPKELRRLRSDTSITALAFSPDGKRLGIAFYDSVRIFDAAARSESFRIKREGPVLSVAFDLNGSDVITAAGAPELQFKHDSLSSDKLKDKACSLLKSNLSPDQWNVYLPTEQYRKICLLLP